MPSSTLDMITLMAGRFASDIEARFDIQLVNHDVSALIDTIYKIVNTRTVEQKH